MEDGPKRGTSGKLFAGADAEPLCSSWRLPHGFLQEFAEGLPASILEGQGDVTERVDRFALRDPGAFWEAVLDYAGVESEGSREPSLLPVDRPPYARFFPELRVNYAREILRGPRGEPPHHPVIITLDERGGRFVCTRRELRLRVGAVQAALREAGVRSGDVVAAIMPNRAEAVIVFLAAASLGAVWSACGPELSPAAAVARFAPLGPKVLLVSDGFRYGGESVATAAHIAAVLERLPCVQIVLLSGDDVGTVPPGRKVLVLEEALTRFAGIEPTFERLPFEHPLWVLHTSGTTGPVKGIVHGHGGILLEHLKLLLLQNDIGPSDRIAWYTSLGWMLWNVTVSALRTGATVYFNEGSPMFPDAEQIWRFVSAERITLLGVVSPLVNFAASLGTVPRERHDLSSLRALAVSGAPLNPKAARWVVSALGEDTVPLSMSGGTDICSAFLQPAPGGRIRSDAIAARALGVDAAVFDTEGRPVLDRMGELVVRSPLPSMPLFFWGDEDGSRYLASYYERYPRTWCHGDAVTENEDGSYVMHGRSDSTLNRGGVRVGSSEYQRAIDPLPEVKEALIVEAPPAEPGAESRIVAFVVLSESVSEEGVADAVREAVAAALSPAHVPDAVVVAPALPRTSTGKLCEVPVKRILAGMDPEKAVDRDSLEDPAALDFYVSFAHNCST